MVEFAAKENASVVAVCAAKPTSVLKSQASTA
ncbi:Uncharacterised protein [Vibrio cholerae]|nr:Uncharacterised protein [Vibrio cholerae]